MGKVLLSLHVLAGIIFVGPVTVAVSLFPRYARLAADVEQRAAALSVLVLLRRISTAYAVLGLSVPVFGLGVAIQLGVLTDPWLIISIAITVGAALLLVLVVLPGQRRLLDGLTDPTPSVAPAATRRLASASGVFALLWSVVVVLMIIRPGSTTGV